MTTSRLLSPRSFAAVLLLALVAALAVPFGGTPASAGAFMEIFSLSGRGDTVIGGDVLVEVVLPDGGALADLEVDVNGTDVTDAFGARDGHYAGRIIGLVNGLALGANVITAELPDGRGATFTVTNHPQTGPVTSGPQIEPWRCDDGELGDCARDAVFTYVYKPASGGGFQAYDDSVAPGQVATTTTDQGVEVPFIVRLETGNAARDEYKIAVLFQPELDWTAVQPQEQWNHKTVITHGASCDTNYQMGSAPDVMLEDALGRGFAVISHALDNAGHNCNLATMAEAVFMTKELLADQYGEIRYAIGTGCSGGALAQQQIANAYPGVYQGILPGCSFADAWSTANQYVDYVLLLNYFRDGAAADVAPFWVAPDRTGNTDYGTAAGRLFGHPNLANPVSFTEAIPNSGEPTRSCVPAAEVYDETTNPDGVRCTLQDYMVNIFGTRAADGFANRPYDNVGIQYGLSGLQNGTIDFTAFLDVNTDIGGFDIDLDPIAERSPADPAALTNLFRSGASNTASNMDEVAIIDLRGPDPGAFHDAYRTSVLEARLIREHGHADNHVRWQGAVALLGDANYVTQGIVAMDSWLAAVEADTSAASLAQKIVTARATAGIETRCTNGAGADVPQAFCDGVVDEYSSPRIEAGMPLTDDVAKCQLIAVRDFDYGDFAPTEDQYLELEATFPDGVCDYTKVSISNDDTTPWMTYAAGPGLGVGLGPAPVSVPFGPGVDGAASDIKVLGAELASTGGGAALLAAGALGLAGALGRRRRED